jgi:acetyl-CoA synthetase
MSHCFTFPDSGDPHEGFSWDLPPTFNVGTAVFDHGAWSATALRHVSPSNTVHSFSYDDLDTASDAVAATLRERGVEKGDRVVICLPQSPELLVGHLAALKCGAVVVPVSVLVGDETVRYVLRAIECSCACFEASQATRFESIGDAAQLALSLGDDRYDRAGAFGAFAEHIDPDATVEATETAPADPAFVMFTSGTTADPKGVVQGHEYLLGVVPGEEVRGGADAPVGLGDV